VTKAKYNKNIGIKQTEYSGKVKRYYHEAIIKIKTKKEKVLIVYMSLSNYIEDFSKY
jgi:hypothetical protein